MNYEYELAKKLKENGFPQTGFSGRWATPDRPTPDLIEEIIAEQCYIPTLSELIEACGDRFEKLLKGEQGFVAFPPMEYCIKNKYVAHHTEFPEEAVANLILALLEADYVFVNGRLELNKK